MVLLVPAPYEVLVRSFPWEDVQPAQTLSIAVRITALGGARIAHAQRVEGILYHLFDATELFVGQLCQWQGPRSASVLFDALRRVTDLLMTPPGWEALPQGFEDAAVPLSVGPDGANIYLTVRNNSNEPLPFAIKLVGTALVEEGSSL